MTNTLVDPRVFHPRTGVRAIFQREDGRQVWPHCGADSDEGDEGSEDDGDESEEDSEDDDDEDSEDDDKDEKGKAKKKADKSDTVSRAEFERLKNHLSNSDKKKTAAEKELKALKEKDLPDAEKVKVQLTEVTEERDTFRDKYTKMARTNAFLTASAQEKITWIDPEDAQAIGGKAFSELEIDDDGNVLGVRDFVKSLAKRKPHLVNKETNSESDDDSKNGSGSTKKGASGSNVGGRTKTSNGKAKGEISNEDLLKRFPALRK